MNFTKLVLFTVIFSLAVILPKFQLSVASAAEIGSPKHQDEMIEFFQQIYNSLESAREGDKKVEPILMSLGNSTMERDRVFGHIVQILTREFENEPESRSIVIPDELRSSWQTLKDQVGMLYLNLPEIEKVSVYLNIKKERPLATVLAALQMVYESRTELSGVYGQYFTFELNSSIESLRSYMNLSIRLEGNVLKLVTSRSEVTKDVLKWVDEDIGNKISRSDLDMLKVIRSDLDNLQKQFTLVQENLQAMKLSSSALEIFLRLGISTLGGVLELPPGIEDGKSLVESKVAQMEMAFSKIQNAFDTQAKEIENNNIIQDQITEQMRENVRRAVRSAFVSHPLLIDFINGLNELYFGLVRYRNEAGIDISVDNDFGKKLLTLSTEIRGLLFPEFKNNYPNLFDPLSSNEKFRSDFQGAVRKSNELTELVNSIGDDFNEILSRFGPKIDQCNFILGRKPRRPEK